MEILKEKEKLANFGSSEGFSTDTGEGFKNELKNEFEKENNKKKECPIHTIVYRFIRQFFMFYGIRAAISLLKTLMSKKSLSFSNLISILFNNKSLFCKYLKEEEFGPGEKDKVKGS
jgi:sulfur relay (sulfurtransferase) DsrC/TusE family protein